MSIRNWKIEDIPEGKIPVPVIKLRCAWCRGLPLLHEFRPGINPDGGLKVDVHMKCIDCEFYSRFGVPLSKEEFNELSTSPLVGKLINRELALEIANCYLPEDVEKRKLKSRLKKLGYW